MTTETTNTTKLMPYVDCFRWMYEQGYRILMWPAIRMEGHSLCMTHFEPLHETIDDYVAGLRREIAPLCFVVRRRA